MKDDNKELSNSNNNSKVKDIKKLSQALRRNLKRRKNIKKNSTGQNFK